MYRIMFQNSIYKMFEYENESDFEKQIVEHSKEIFGENSVYIDVKKRISLDNIISIPDGYLIDFSFPQNPRLYILENELVTHDPYKHIGEQLLKFAISYKGSGRKIKSFLLEEINRDMDIKQKINKGFKRADYRNIDAFLEDLIFDKSVGAIVIIDQITSDLTNVLNQLTIKTDVLEFQTYIKEGEDNNHIHKFMPFQQDIRDISEAGKPLEQLDTIVVPANEEGFNETFLGARCWYAIRISSSMIDKIKYIAGYQTAPISAITYYAEVAKIEKYEDTEKYIVYFKDRAKKIGPINLVPKSRVKAPQAPRYTNFEKLSRAKTLDEAF